MFAPDGPSSCDGLCLLQVDHPHVLVYVCSKWTILINRFIFASDGPSSCTDLCLLQMEQPHILVCVISRSCRWTVPVYWFLFAVNEPPSCTVFLCSRWTIQFSGLFEAFRMSGPQLPRNDIVIAINHRGLSAMHEPFKVCMTLNYYEIVEVCSSR